jgi:hypothetical protein
MRSEFRVTLSAVRAFVVILQLLPPVALLVGLALVADQRLVRTPAFTAALGLLVLAVVQLVRHWNDTDEWARSGRWIAALTAGAIAGYATDLGTDGGGHTPSWMLATTGGAVAGACGALLLFTVLRRLCLRPILAADPTDLAASPLAVTWRLDLPYRMRVGPDEVGVNRRVQSRHWGSRVVWYDRADWSEVGDVAAVTVSEPGTMAYPTTRTGLTIAIGRPVVRMSVRAGVWCVPVRSADRLARLITLRAAGATRPAGAGDGATAGQWS